MNRKERRIQDRQKQRDIKKMPIVEVPNKFFLKGTKLRQKKTVFIFRRGGLGDYINFMSTMFFIADSYPQIYGLLYVSKPFYDVAKFLMEDVNNWEVRDRATLKDLNETAFINDIGPDKIPINATGCHLMDLGAIYFAGLSYLPKEYRFLPRIEYKSGKDWGLPKRYAVFTPGYTAKSRRVKPEYYNELTKYCETQGITPVHLGKANFSQSEVAKGQGYKATIQEDFDLTIGVDLTEKTTLLEAIEIMGHAQFVLGLDNGLLHFAGCTSVPIIFGHNIASVEHRAIRRPEGDTVNIEIPREALSCIGCQSYMRYTGGHHHNLCFYGHYACLDILFNNKCETWKNAIDHILKTKNEKHGR